MVLHLARFVGRARAMPSVRGARILALCVHAGHVRRTVVVVRALAPIRRANQLAVLVDNEAELAHADGPMAARLAPLVRLARVAGAIARVDALAVGAAGERLVAVAVARAGGAQIVRSRRCAGLALCVRFAFDVGVANVAAGARAARPMQRRLAQGVAAACVAHRARVGADMLQACLFVGTLGVVGAFFVWSGE